MILKMAKFDFLNVSENKFSLYNDYLEMSTKKKPKKMNSTKNSKISYENKWLKPSVKNHVTNIDINIWINNSNWDF